MTQWLLDTGATSSSVNDIRLFDQGTVTTIPPRAVSGINKDTTCFLHSRIQGHVTLFCKNTDGRTQTLRLSNVYYIPEITENIISVGDLVFENNAFVTFTKFGADVHTNGRIIAASLKGTDYELTSLAQTQICSRRLSRKRRRLTLPRRKGI